MNRHEENIISKRIQTTMIGALFQFEESFGYLWGQDKEDKNLTENEKRFRLKWESTRNNILNNGNSQLRKCLSDLYRLTETKYSYKFYNRKDDDL